MDYALADKSSYLLIQDGFLSP